MPSSAIEPVGDSIHHPAAAVQEASPRNRSGPGIGLATGRTRKRLGAYRTPRVLDRRIKLNGYDALLRQLTIADLGHEEPTLLLTNQLNRSPCHLIGRYAQRMLIENNIEDGIDFFHMDALSSAVAMKINCDLQLTLMASSLYRLLAVRMGNGYEIAKSRHLFRDLINASAGIRITDEAIVVKFQRRAHSPLLIAAGFDKTDVVIPWLRGALAVGVRVASSCYLLERGVKLKTNKTTAFNIWIRHGRPGPNDRGFPLDGNPG